MFFVFTGILTVFVPTRRNSVCKTLQRPSEGRLDNNNPGVLQNISAGDFFGENALFADAPRVSSVRSKSSCILYSLSRHSLEMVFDLFPDWKTRVLQIAKLQQKEQKQRRNSDRQQLRSFDASPVAPLPTDHILQKAFQSPGSWCCSLEWLSALSTIVEAQSPQHIMWLRVQVFSTLPAQIRLETVVHIVDLPLQALLFQVFRPLVQGDGPSLTRLTHAIADQLRFDSYPSGEHVLLEGRMPEGLFFVVSGQLVATTKAQGPEHPIAQYMRGDYFGERGILTHSMSKMSVQTQMPCDLFLLSTYSLISILSADEFFSIVQITMESLFHSLLRRQSRPGGRYPFPMPPHVWEQHLRTALQRQRLKWAMNSSEAKSSPSSKGEVLWSKLLTSVLDTSDSPLSCFQLFRPFIEMAGPKGELFERTSPQRRINSVPAKVTKKAVGHLRTLVRQIGAVASNTSNRVVPLLQGSTGSRVSSVSRSRREDRSIRLFTERSHRTREPPNDVGSEQ
ncbi:hypothetical protein KRP22_008090 [Phytophthora ramorum]|nr:hypothetical protein KRP22_3900 [Phytophthora ramorum]